MAAYRYLLRYVLDPRYRTEEKLSALLEFCQEARIDDVAFFISPENLNVGHVTREEADRWLDAIGKAKPKLAAMGITTSLNPWTTLMHAWRGRKLQPGQDFTPMVDAQGHSGGTNCCPLCPSFTAYLVETYAHYAEALQPNILWIEDDFRMHNHAPLQGGGCFCPLHLEAYGQRLGHSVTRQDLVQALLTPGAPTPERQAYLDVHRESMNALAERIGEAVHAVSPQTKLGLMSDTASSMMAEGRQWTGMLEALAQGHPTISRPHLPYGEQAPQTYFVDFCHRSRHTRAVLGPDVHIYPELENGTAGAFVKSMSYIRYQLDTSVLLDAEGMTLSILGFLGNGAGGSDSAPLARMLHRSKPFLNALADLRLHQHEQQGVLMPAFEDTGYTLHLPAKAQLDDLNDRQTAWSGVFARYGIPAAFTDNLDVQEQVVALCGQAIRALSPDAIRQLFAHNQVLLDGESAYALWDMGLGQLAGIQSACWQPLHSGQASYEQAMDGQTYGGLAEARLPVNADYLCLGYGRPVQQLTQAFAPDGRVMGPGMTVIENRVCILPYRDVLADWASVVRRDMLQKVLIEHFKASFPLVADGAHLAAFAYPQGLVLVNNTLDAVETISLYWPNAPKGLRLLSREHLKPLPLRTYPFPGGLRLALPLSPMEVAVLLPQ